MTGDDDFNSKRNESEVSFRDWLTLAWCTSGLLLGFIVLVIVSTGIFEFLHAPIGIKDNPPDPGLLVQYSQFAFNPVALIFASLWGVNKAVARYSTKWVLLGVVSFGTCVVLAVSFLGVIIHQELIPGSFYFWGRFGLPGLIYFWNKIAPLLFALLLLLIDLAFAYGAASDWKQWKTFRERVGAAFLTLSAFPAVIGYFGLIRLFLMDRQTDSKNPLWSASIGAALLLFFCGVACLPKPNTIAHSAAGGIDEQINT